MCGCSARYVCVLCMRVFIVFVLCRYVGYLCMSCIHVVYLCIYACSFECMLVMLCTCVFLCMYDTYKCLYISRLCALRRYVMNVF